MVNFFPIIPMWLTMIVRVISRTKKDSTTNNPDFNHPAYLKESSEDEAVPSAVYEEATTNSCIYEYAEQIAYDNSVFFSIYYE